jgi:hypothetical protein
MATFGSFFYRQTTMTDCDNAGALSSFFTWVLSDPAAAAIADRQGFVLTSSSDALMRRFYTLQQNFTCDGVAVSSIYGCILDGELCSSAGVCSSNSCVCDSGRTGTYCESYVSSASSSDSTAIALGTLFSNTILIY